MIKPTTGDTVFSKNVLLFRYRCTRKITLRKFISPACRPVRRRYFYVHVTICKFVYPFTSRRTLHSKFNCVVRNSCSRRSRRSLTTQRMSHERDSADSSTSNQNFWRSMLLQFTIAHEHTSYLTPSFPRYLNYSRNPKCSFFRL